VIELVYAVCAWVLLPATANATHYDLYVNEVFTQEAVIEHYDGEEFLGMKVEACVDAWYMDELYQYKVSNSSGESELSPSLTLNWVWDFDHYGDGVVGITDFGAFVGDYGTSAARSDADESGIVGMIDFGLFSQRYAECNNEVKVVPCEDIFD